MTVDELRILFNNKYGLYEWPSKYKVDHETYANVCQYVFEEKVKEESMFGYIRIFLGHNKGILFKGVELILDRK